MLSRLIKLKFALMWGSSLLKSKHQLGTLLSSAKFWCYKTFFADRSVFSFVTLMHINTKAIDLIAFQKANALSCIIFAFGSIQLTFQITYCCSSNPLTQCPNHDLSLSPFAGSWFYATLVTHIIFSKDYLIDSLIIYQSNVVSISLFIN